MLKNKFVYAILIISSIIGIGSFALALINNDNKNFDVSLESEINAKKIIENCKIDMHCSVEALTNMTKDKNQQVVLTTFSDLVLLYDNSTYPCHETAHHLGMWLYGYTGDLGKALPYAKQLCGGAVFHGILENYFMTQRIHNVNPSKIVLSELCPVDKDNPYSILRWQCLHGIGHGLTAFYNYDVINAVSRCDELKLGWEQLSCSKGVFMQNIVNYYETGKGNFNKSDIFFPCDKINEKYAPACYHYQTSYILKQESFYHAFDDCDKIVPGNLVKYCYYGMGRQLSSAAYYDVREGMILCNIGNQSSYHTDCMRGMLLTLLNGDTNTDKGFKFCNLSEKNFKAACYDSLGKWIKMLYSVPQERQRECSKAENQTYSNICMNASLDNISLL